MSASFDSFQLCGSQFPFVRLLLFLSFKDLYLMCKSVAKSLNNLIHENIDETSLKRMGIETLKTTAEAFIQHYGLKINSIFSKQNIFHTVIVGDFVVSVFRGKLGCFNELTINMKIPTKIFRNKTNMRKLISTNNLIIYLRINKYKLQLEKDDNDYESLRRNEISDNEQLYFFYNEELNRRIEIVFVENDTNSINRFYDNLIEKMDLTVRMCYIFIKPDNTISFKVKNLNQIIYQFTNVTEERRFGDKRKSVTGMRLLMYDHLKFDIIAIGGTGIRGLKYEMERIERHYSWFEHVGKFIHKETKSPMKLLYMPNEEDFN